MIEVALGERSYRILVQSGLLKTAGEHLAPFARNGRLIMLSDETVWGLYGEAFPASDPILVPPGEASKSWAMLGHVIDRLLAMKIERGDYLIALGGGVVGDLAGFAAAIVKRGCGYVQIPTTLLAQADSSVGGKTGINVAAGKNLVGAFHQPAMVLIDPDTLGTLPARHLRAGYAEVVKYGLIGDPDFFGWCETNGAALLAGVSEARLHAIETSVGAKAAIVAEDERERTGRRALLNFGHTFAHALEAETGFSDRLLHGEAVATGMVLAFHLSVELGLCPPQDAVRVANHLQEVGFDTSIQADGAALLAHMANDKKVSEGRLPFVLTRGIGRAFVNHDVDLGEVARFLDRQS